MKRSGLRPLVVILQATVAFYGLLLAENNELSREILPSTAPAVAPEALPPVQPGGIGLKEYVRVHTVRLERDLILRSLGQENGNVTRTARLLDISRKALQLKMKEYRLRDEGVE